MQQKHLSVSQTERQAIEVRPITYCPLKAFHCQQNSAKKRERLSPSQRSSQISEIMHTLTAIAGSILPLTLLVRFQGLEVPFQTRVQGWNRLFWSTILAYNLRREPG